MKRRNVRRSELLQVQRKNRRKGKRRFFFCTAAVLPFSSSPHRRSKACDGTADRRAEGGDSANAFAVFLCEVLVALEHLRNQKLSSQDAINAGSKFWPDCRRRSTLGYVTMPVLVTTSGGQISVRRDQRRASDRFSGGYCASAADAVPMPSLKVNNGQVKAGDVDRIVSRKPKDVWAIRLARISSTTSISGHWILTIIAQKLLNQIEKSEND